ncbi:alpha-1,4-glucan--maltose-1-phosphate maltosyltransferase [Cryptosporangium japonicum]|uniref:Alpha-1,4-glucan:maltose-1-phosphate maltosyltransferase n=1 Tax=Cryptosporangium japonicum TaxID=80872 RepID=A0ABP3EK48_9ACTN
MTGRFAIEDITPVVAAGLYPARAVVGELMPVSATVFREGHDAVGANVVWTAPDGRRTPFTPMVRGENDRWHASVVPDAPGRWTFVVEAWGDPYETWHHAVEVKIAAGQSAVELANDLETGARLLLKAGRFAPRQRRDELFEAAAALRDTTRPLAERVEPGLALAEVMRERPVRDLVTRSPAFSVWVDRERALYGAWYEFFPRSEGAVVPEPGSDAVGAPTHGTFRTAARRLPAIADMNFDVVYLPPIHPIGRVNRKGKNNTLTPGPDDVGSPWAIGAAEGGHDAIHPQLGSFEDFDAFVARTRELGMEIALDLALQCAPDHPWVTEHPEWFTTLPDGTIAYAENPPKKYQDIYPLNFDNDRNGIYAEMLRVVLLWVSHGVKIFRVDNPHTKPTDFWHWLIWEVKKVHPDVLFLAEAFTRPAMMHHLAKIGFTQSYTYFTWRTEKWEIEEYGRELVESGHYMRPNFFVNTPDILHASLQYGGPAMFAIRAVLASMMSPTWGVYSGYELYEHVAVRPGSEEYLDSEKYQLRPRDWKQAEAEGRTLAPFLGRLNELRRAHPALHRLTNLRFHHVDNEALICFSKQLGDDTVLVVCTLDPHNTHWGNTALDMPELGFEWHERFRVVDELTGASFDWGQHNAVRLDPYQQVAHVFSIHRQTS